MPELSPESLLPALASAPRLWVAYSGGLDSHVLLHACAVLRGRLDGELRAVHLDHGLHADSLGWAGHCRGVCEAMAVPLTVRRLRIDAGPGDSLEAVARAARYAVLAALLGPDEAVATAQHRDDQAETLLLALLRGSGVHGLAAMPARSALGAGRLLRPLLGFGRADLRAYALRHGLEWVDDPSNADTGLDRNFLRHRVLPALGERWPSAARTLARSAAHCAEAAELIDAAADERLAALGGARPETLSVGAVRRLEPALARSVLRRWLVKRGFRAPDRVRLHQIFADVMQARADADPLVGWDGCEVRRYRDDLFALAPLPAPPPAQVIAWDGAGPLELPNALGRLVPAQGPECPLSELKVLIGSRGMPPLRCRRPGGAPSRSLKDLFQQAGVPPWLRVHVPLLQRGGDLAGVAGVARCGESPLAVIWEGHPWTGLGVFIEGLPPAAR